MSIAILTSNESGANSLIDINANFSELNTLKATIASPTFTGTPTLPTGTIAVTQTAANNTTAVATTAYVDNAATPLNIETTTGVTHSLTTTAGQRVMVWAKGNNLNSAGAGGATITLKYNTVTKDTSLVGLTVSTSILQSGFSLMYTEIPGAGTQNITVETNQGTLSNVVIMVLKRG